jgi:hypothetical protein
MRIQAGSGTGGAALKLYGSQLELLVEPLRGRDTAAGGAVLVADLSGLG